MDKNDSVWKTLDSEPLQLLRQIQEHESAKAALASSLTSPKVGGWGFVPATPTLVPGPDASPFMTWGELDGTPLLLDPSATPSRTGTTTFKLPEITSREKVAQKLTEEASRTYRHKSKIAKLSHTAARLHSPSGPASPFGRERMLSPAAHSLLKAKNRSGLSGDSQLRASYSSPQIKKAGQAHTPTPKKMITTPSQLARTPQLAALNATTKLSSSAGPIQTTSSLTDNLLYM